MNDHVYQCPHCNDYIVIFPCDINCGIFRHAVYKDGKEFNQHATKLVCDNEINNTINGCGKPFKIDKILNKLIICDYI